MKEVNPNKIALMGLSFGGALVPRALAFEKRVKIGIANPGVLNWSEAMFDQFSSFPGLLSAYKNRPELFNDLVAGLTKVWPLAGWWFKDAAHKHGVEKPNELFDKIKMYNNEKIVQNISCKMLIMDGTEESFSKGQAKKLYDALKCPKEMMLFDLLSSSQLHCQNGGLAHAGERFFDWLEINL